jgi:hypothetical protein
LRDEKRELLRKVINSVPFTHCHEELKKEIEEELAKPEDEPVAYIDERTRSDGAEFRQLSWDKSPGFIRLYQDIFYYIH